MRECLAAAFRSRGFGAKPTGLELGTTARNAGFSCGNYLLWRSPINYDRRSILLLFAAAVAVLTASSRSFGRKNACAVDARRIGRTQKIRNQHHTCASKKVEFFKKGRIPPRPPGWRHCRLKIGHSICSPVLSVSETAVLRPLLLVQEQNRQIERRNQCKICCYPTKGPRVHAQAAGKHVPSRITTSPVD